MSNGKVVVISGIPGSFKQDVFKVLSNHGVVIHLASLNKDEMERIFSNINLELAQNDNVYINVTNLKDEELISLCTRLENDLIPFNGALLNASGKAGMSPELEKYMYENRNTVFDDIFGEGNYQVIIIPEKEMDEPTGDVEVPLER